MSYLAHTYTPGLKKALERIEECTADILDQFDYVLVTGLSGIIPGAIFCDRYNKALVVQRKDNERSHGSPVEGPYDWDDFKPLGDESGGYIIIDDFMASGNTIERLLGAHDNGRLPKFVVLYLRDQSLRMSTSHFRLDASGPPGRYTVTRVKSC